MNALPSLVPLLFFVTLVPAIYGAFIKLSASILRYKGITWKQGFIFGLIVSICSLVLRGAVLLIGFSLPIALSMAIGLLINLLIGVWFFSKRGTKVDGSSLGRGGALQLTGFALVLLIFAGAVLSMVPKLLMATNVP